jgi:integration host factor subunit beta
VTLSKGGRVEVRGFGSFCLHYQARRNAHNPKTGEKVIAPPRYRVHFKPGKELRNRVNRAKVIIQNIARTHDSLMLEEV